MLSIGRVLSMMPARTHEYRSSSKNPDGNPAWNVLQNPNRSVSYKSYPGTGDTEADPEYTGKYAGKYAS